jgi:hypothetical protein
VTFLESELRNRKNNSFLLTQTGFITIVIKAGGMEACKKCATPATTTPVGAGIYGELLKKDWEYVSFV